MSKSIAGSLQIDYEIHPNNFNKKIIDKHSIITLTINGDVYLDNSIKNTPPIILNLIYTDLDIRFSALKPVIDVLKETHKAITTAGGIIE